MMRDVPRPASVLLSCPGCDRQISLRAAEGLPANQARLIVPCPDCDGHHVANATSSQPFVVRHALPLAFELGSMMTDSLETGAAREARG